MIKRLTLVIVKVYLKRWRIEEYFRFKKQQFDFEDVRVRSLNSIRAMNLILSIAIGFIAVLSEKRKESLLVVWISKIAKRIYDIPKFNYYDYLMVFMQSYKNQKQVLKVLLNLD